MTRKCLISFGFNCLTLLLFFGALHLMSLATLNKWVGVSIGITILVISLVLYIALKKSNVAKYVLISANAIADGIAASSLFVYIGAYPIIWHSVVLFFALCALFFLYIALTKIKFFQDHYIICMILYLLLITAGTIAAAIITKLPVFALACLALIPFIGFFITTALITIDDTEHIGKIGIASFAALAVVIIVVLIVISGGDGLDLGGGLGGATRNKRNYNPYDYTTLDMLNS